MTVLEEAAAAFHESQAGRPGGAQACVVVGGTVVLDEAAGPDGYDRGSLQVTMSAGKGIVAACVHALVQEGRLGLDDPVARHWPEFAAEGKEAITVADCLAHRAGLPHFDAALGLGAADLADWSRCTSALAGMAPLFPPGEAVLYHSVTYGFLLGEVVRRVTGRTVGDWLAARGVDAWIGLPVEQEARVAGSVNAGPRPDRRQIETSLRAAGIDPADRLVAAVVSLAAAAQDRPFGTRALRAAEIPAANAVASARGLAAFYAGVLDELTPATLATATTRQNRGLPPALRPGPPPEGEDPDPFGLGFQLPGAMAPMFGAGSFGHTGAGGQVAFAHAPSRSAVAFTCTHHTWDQVGPDPRWAWMDLVGLEVL